MRKTSSLWRVFVLLLRTAGVLSVAVAASAQVRPWTPLGPQDGPRVSAIAIDPEAPSNVYAAEGDGSAVFKSVDGGASWRTVPTTLSASLALAIDPQASMTLYVGGAGGVVKSTNGGESWLRSSEGLTTADVGHLAIDPLITSTVYAGTSAGIFKSTMPRRAGMGRAAG